MKIFKSLSLLALVTLVSITISCGPGDDDGPTDKEVLVEALTGSWTLDASNSQFANTELDGSGIGVTFSETGFSLSGGITTYVSGGTYTVTDAGAITDVAVNIAASNDLELKGTPSFTINGAKDTITIVFSTQEASGRVSGLGDYKLVFNKAS
ncbi:MAG: hypothetical protein RIC35_15565 [Marinoscillum sp.]